MSDLDKSFRPKYDLTKKSKKNVLPKMDSNAPIEKDALSSSQRCTSMIELNNLGLIHKLNIELEALSDSNSESQTEEVHDEEDDFFFFDEDEGFTSSADGISNSVFETNITKKTSFLPEPQKVDDAPIRRTMSMSNIHQDSNYKKVSKAMKITLGKLSEENVSTFSEHTEELHTSTSQAISSSSTHSVPLELDRKPIKSALKKSNDELYVDKSLLRTYSQKDLASMHYPVTTITKNLRRNSPEDEGTKDSSGTLKRIRQRNPKDDSNCLNKTTISSEVSNETVPSSCRTSISESSSQSSVSVFDTGKEEQAKMKRNISFSTLEVRHYDITLGDNPGCSEGPPVSLDWKYDQSDALDIDDYESNRNPRRYKGDLRVDHNTRYFTLSSRFTSSDLKRATDAAKQIRLQRQKSISKKKLDPLHEVLESTERKVKRLLGKSKKVNSRLKEHGPGKI